jgi:hypothetical protein
MVTKRTGRPRGRPDWDLLLDRDRYLIAAFWATLIHDNQLKGDQKVTRHAVAMLYAAIKRGELTDSADNLATLNRGEGKLKFRTSITRVQFDEHAGVKANDIKTYADNLRRKAERAMKSNRYEWLEALTAAFALAFYHPDREYALIFARLNCLAVSEMAFFEQSLKPFIVGRFDPAKRVFFGLPDFMPNFVPANRA